MIVYYLYVVLQVSLCLVRKEVPVTWRMSSRASRLVELTMRYDCVSELKRGCQLFLSFVENYPHLKANFTILAITFCALYINIYIYIYFVCV